MNNSWKLCGWRQISVWFMATDADMQRFIKYTTVHRVKIQ